MINFDAMQQEKLFSSYSSMKSSGNPNQMINQSTSSFKKYVQPQSMINQSYKSSKHSMTSQKINWTESLQIKKAPKSFLQIQKPQMTSVLSSDQQQFDCNKETYLQNNIQLNTMMEGCNLKENSNQNNGIQKNRIKNSNKMDKSFKKQKVRKFSQEYQTYKKFQFLQKHKQQDLPLNNQQPSIRINTNIIVRNKEESRIYQTNQISNFPTQISSPIRKNLLTPGYKLFAEDHQTPTQYSAQLKKSRSKQKNLKNQRAHSAHSHNSDDQQFRPKHNNHNRNKFLDAFIRPKVMGQHRAGIHNQCKSQRLIKKMHGYHYNKNFEQYYNSKLLQYFHSKRQYEIAQTDQKKKAIQWIIEQLREYKFSIKIHKQLSEKFSAQVYSIITELFQQIFRKTYIIMLQTQWRRIMQQSQDDQYSSNKYIDVQGCKEFNCSFDQILIKKFGIQNIQLLYDNKFQEYFSIQLPKNQYYQTQLLSKSQSLYPK